jgi:hypothetical protein
MMMIRPKAPALQERQKMANAFIESAAYQGGEFDQTLVNLIRKGCVVFITPDLFEITEEGMNEVDNG